MEQRAPEAESESITALPSEAGTIFGYAPRASPTPPGCWTAWAVSALQWTRLELTSGDRCKRVPYYRSEDGIVVEAGTIALTGTADTGRPQFVVGTQT